MVGRSRGGREMGRSGAKRGDYKGQHKRELSVASDICDRAGLHPDFPGCYTDLLHTC